MKTFRPVVIITSITTVLAAFVLLSRQAPPPPAAGAMPSPEAGTSPAGNLTLRTRHDAMEIFQRAFWREPGEGDRILHAERREWTAPDPAAGVRRWQWFITLEPGPELMAWLRDKNPFQLGRAHSPKPLPAGMVPGWFPAPTGTDGGEIMQSGDGEMTLIFDPARHRLHATGQGHGFALPSPPDEALPPAGVAAAPALGQRPPR